ncbi:NADH:flavin oxidoreductase [Ramlibacter humi]|uniref:NADH:flavin oxidoreductase n=1 Tax=Ramlibacter humi TaxID=2530451 RepID=A0A4Z0BFH4_9BURK|nr:NADH:flavin oxidoreductase [Ramlibacter humi]TFY96608.1 NADH:flavin oxidoreductase [Ramlibacter humi]
MTLLQPLQLRGLLLGNRIAVAAMSRMQANDDGSVSEDMPAYYARYAAEGAGLVITEAIATDDVAARAYWRQPCLSRDSHVEGWRRVVDAVHEAGGTVFAQLQHGGRLCEPGLNPSHLAASEGAASGSTWQTGIPNASAREATRQEIDAIVEGFAAAAARACAAGFDGIELHGARGYLLDQFLSASTNRRTDAYGGDLAGRLKLPLRVVRAVRGAVGRLPLSWNFSLYKMDDAAYQPPGGREEVQAIARELVAAGVDILHVTTRKLVRAEPWGEPLALTLAKAVGGTPVIGNGGLKTLEDAEAALDSTGCGMVSLARPWLANPDWLRRNQRGEDVLAYEPGMERRPLL